jgi:hypothetical protein
MGVNPIYAGTKGRGVFIETYGNYHEEEEKTLREVAEEFSGEERTDIDELYQFNFVTYEFKTYAVALEVVAECEKRLPEGDFNTISIDDLEGENFEAWSTERNL